MRPTRPWPGSPQRWVEDRIRMYDDDPTEDALRDRLAELKQDHADLDAVIQAVALSPLPDIMLIGRLKRKKLALKDQIAHVEDLLTPDIIA